jgi:hypothetical protein
LNQSFVLPKVTPCQPRYIDRISTVIKSLDAQKAWKVEITEVKRVRTDPQNKFLWAMYSDILRLGGEDMAGWSRNDLHDFFLMDHFGTETYEVFGRKRVRAVRRSSRLNKQEFSDYIAHIQQFMAERGVYLASPNE